MSGNATKTGGSGSVESENNSGGNEVDSMSANIREVESSEAEIYEQEAVAHLMGLRNREQRRDGMQPDHFDEGPDGEYDDPELVGGESDEPIEAGIEQSNAAKIDSSAADLAGDFGFNATLGSAPHESGGAVRSDIDPENAVPDISPATVDEFNFLTESELGAYDHLSTDHPAIVKVRETSEELAEELEDRDQGAEYILAREVRVSGQDTVAQEKSKAIEAELEEYTANWVHKRGERNFEVSLNDSKTQPETHREELVDLHRSRARPEWREAQDHIRAQIESFEVDDSDLFEDYVDKIHTRTEERMAKSFIRLQLKAQLIEASLPSSEKTIEVAGEERTAKVWPDIALTENYKIQPAVLKAQDYLDAGEAVLKAIEKSIPSTTEHIHPDYTQTADARLEIINVYGKKKGRLNNHKQKNVCEGKDKNGNIVKLTIWVKADAEEFGRDHLGLGLMDYAIKQNVPVVREGDTIDVYDAHVGSYDGRLSLSVSQNSFLRIVEEGEGETFVSKGLGRIGAMQDYSGDSEASTQMDDAIPFDELDCGGVPLPRIRPHEVTLKRQGHYVNAVTLGIGNMAFHSEVAYDGSYNHGADDLEEAPKMPEGVSHTSTFSKWDHSNLDEWEFSTQAQLDPSELDIAECDDDETDTSTTLNKSTQAETGTLSEFKDSLVLREGGESDGKDCPECGSSNISSYQQQVGGADEGMTSFCKCGDCGHNWRGGYGA